MEDRAPSRTAVISAMHRAAHFLLDDTPKILSDPFACSFAGFSSNEDFLKDLDTLIEGHFARRAAFALRSRYAEDQLRLAVGQGISQYVILGAGLDSFAYRCPDLMRELQVYEIDHPASQAWKRRRLTELGITAPPELHYVPLDFEHETLANGLRTAGFDPKAKAFFSWLGVTQYLTREAVLSTLRQIASISAPGSELVFKFIVPAASLGSEKASLVTASAARCAEVGEPWLSFFEPRDLETELKRLGFEQIFHLGPEQAFRQYLSGRTDGLRLPSYFDMIKARVGVHHRPFC